MTEVVVEEKADDGGDIGFLIKWEILLVFRGDGYAFSIELCRAHGDPYFSLLFMVVQDLTNRDRRRW